MQFEIIQTGIEVLFSVEALKSSQNPLTRALERGCSGPMPVSQISIIPRLYRAYVEETRKHRFVIFGSGSSQAQEQTVQGKIREAGLEAFATCSKALHKQGDVVEVWGGVRELLEVLDEAKLVGSSVSELTDTLRDTAPWAIRALEQSSGYSCFFSTEPIVDCYAYVKRSG